MNKLYLLYVLSSLLVFSCENSGITQQPESLKGYSVESDRSDMIKIFYSESGKKKKVDILKVNSAYFSTYIPITWEPQIQSDTLFSIVDTLDDNGDNIVIAYSPIKNCKVEDVVKKKEEVIKNTGYTVLFSNSEIVEELQTEINIHTIEIDIGDKDYRQVCYYICPKSKGLITCCLTTSVNETIKKRDVVDFVASQLVSSLNK